MFWYLVFAVIVAWAVSKWWQGKKIRDSVKKQFPCDIPCYPVVGHAYKFLGTDQDRMDAFKSFGLEAIKQGGIAPMWMGSVVYLNVADPEAAEVILKACMEKDQHSMKYARNLTGDGLIFAPVSIWRPRRKILAPLFSLKNLNSFAQVFSRESDVMIHQLEPMSDGRDFSIWKYFSTYTFDSVCETSLGIKINSQKLVSHPFLDAFEELCFIIAKRMMQPWLHSDFVFSFLPDNKRFLESRKIVYDFVEKVIDEKRTELAQRNIDTQLSSNTNKSDQITLLDLLIEASGGSKGYNNVELREEVLVTVMAGNDTSAVGASFAAVMLSRHQEEQAKVYEEMEEVFGDSDRPVQAGDLPRLKYLEVFIKESLRLYPPVPVTVREVNHDVKLPSGKELVAEERITFNIWGIHRNQRYWGADAEEFRPERFLQPLQHPAQFAPFSYGMRNCLGAQYAMMSMKTALASLVRRYRVLPPAALAPAQLHAPLRVKFDIMMKHVDDFVVRLQPRH